MAEVRAYKILIAGGGTGGHIFPAIAIANAIKRAAPATQFLFVGAKGKMEMEKVPQAGFEIKGIDIAGFNRSSLLKNAALPFKLVKSFFQVRQILKDFKPDAVFGVGGYSTYPVLRTAQAKGIPTFIHESNSFAGKANIMLGKKATRIFVASAGMEKFFPAGKIMITGNPVRSAISSSRVSREEGIRFFGLDASKKTVLVIGGSLGARSVNEAIHAGIDAFGQNNLQLIWQTGKLYAAAAKAVAAGKPHIWTNDFIKEMEYAFAAADVAVSRAGAMATAELCVVQKPVIFVPYPHAAEDHQTANAMNLVNRQAALMVKDDTVKEALVPALVALCADAARQQELRKNIAAFGITNADEVIAAEVLRSI